MVSQWTGAEHKAMQKVFLGTLAGVANDRVLCVVHAIKDFTYYAHFETHTDESLAALDAAWVAFHSEKDIFTELGMQNHFNISKIHNIKHYVNTIWSHGTTDGYNTKTSERLHIDLAKAGYHASNKRNFMIQMTTWLSRQEAVQ